MTKKIISTSVALSAIFMFTGCGGGSNGDATSTTTPTSTETIQTGTAFYIDSAVSGINYTCGSKSGITDTDGSFTFEVGGGCTFYLGDMELRGVDAGLLVDGVSVYETDMKIARILQSLDSDGDPSNGITIEANTVAALAEHGITSLPTSEADMDEMLAVIAANGGTEVGETAAQEHVLNTLVVGKTVYQKCGETVDSMVFQANREILSVENGEEITTDYRIEGNILYTIEEDGEDPHIFVDATADFIQFQETEGDITTFYFTEEAAQARAASDCGDGASSSGDFIMITEAMLNGKTFYYSNEEPQGTDYRSWSFSNGTLTIGKAEWEDLSDRDTDVAPYSIEDGKILMEDKPGEFMHIVLYNITDTTWEIRAQSVTDANNGRDMVFYLSKPAHYPAAL